MLSSKQRFVSCFPEAVNLHKHIYNWQGIVLWRQRYVWNADSFTMWKQNKHYKRCPRVQRKLIFWFTLWSNYNYDVLAQMPFSLAPQNLISYQYLEISQTIKRIG